MYELFKTFFFSNTSNLLQRMCKVMLLFSHFISTLHIYIYEQATDVSTTEDASCNLVINE